MQSPRGTSSDVRPSHTENGHSLQEQTHRASVHERMHKWRRRLQLKLEHAELLLDLGAPDPGFDSLITELETFSCCVKALKAEGDL